MHPTQLKAALPLLALPMAIPFLLVAVVGGFAATDSTLDQNGCAPSGVGVGSETVAGIPLDAVQIGVATQIVAAVRGFPATSSTPHAAVIALATARQESGLRNLDYGDRDSLGAFQQRPSQGWGTPEQVRNITHATTSFLQRLVRQPDWQTRPVTEVAADVQRPAQAYRGLYEQWVPLATALTQRLWPTGLDPSPLTLPMLGAGFPSQAWVLPMKPGSYTPTASWHQAGDLWSSGFHTGQDFAAPTGTPVYTAAAGRVELRPSEAGWAGPHLVTIDHGTIDGRQVVSWYAHLSRADVTDGQQVAAGQRIGLVGTEGNITGPHLHFEVRLDGVAVNPLTWLDGADAPSLVGPVGCNPTPGVPGVAGPPRPRSGQPVVASFNVLGHSHTKPGGNRCCRWADSAARTRWATTLLSRHGVSVAGLQEFQAPQAREFSRLTGSAWAMYPGVRRGRWNVNAIIWRTEVWQLVAGRSYETPYFFGHMRRMPVVLLRHRASGQQVWFTNHHNPADARGDAARWRRRATAIEIAHTRDLVATGHPVVVTGDMNERKMFFCRFTTRTPMHAANGGTNTAGSCHPPRPSSVDWIFGSPDVAFSGYQSVRTGLVGRTSDHPLVVATMDIAR